MREARCQPHLLQQVPGPIRGLARRQPGDSKRHLRILERTEFRQQMVELEDEADVPVPEGHQLVVLERVDLYLGNVYAPSVYAI